MCTNNQQSGQVLLEVLVAIAAAAIIIVLGAQLVVVSLTSNKQTAERDVGNRLMEETIETTHNVAVENWLNVYNLNKGSSNNYYPQISSGKWVLTSGAENVTLNSVTFVRSLYIQNMCRNTTTKAVTGVTDSNGTATTCTTSGGSFDPSTLKINVSISWPNAAAITNSEYITRWPNKTCVQTDWSGGTSGSTSTCPVNVYDTKTNIGATTDLQIQ